MAWSLNLFMSHTCSVLPISNCAVSLPPPTHQPTLILHHVLFWHSPSLFWNIISSTIAQMLEHFQKRKIAKMLQKEVGKQCFLKFLQIFQTSCYHDSEAQDIWKWNKQTKKPSTQPHFVNETQEALNKKMFFKKNWEPRSLSKMTQKNLLAVGFNRLQKLFELAQGTYTNGKLSAPVSVKNWNWNWLT